MSYVVKNGMTRTDFASKMGVSESTLYRRMKGRSRLSLDEANKIVAMLNIKRADILPIFLLNNLQKCKFRKGAVDGNLNQIHR